MTESSENTWIDIAREGTFDDSYGRSQTLTASDFDRLIAPFEEGSRRIPLVFGHPKTSAPAFGWVEALRCAGSVLQAKFKQVHEDAKKLVEGGHFKNVSIALTSNKEHIAHVGLLGAVQPAISGLREVSFACEEKPIVIEFSAAQLRPPLDSETEQLKMELSAAKDHIRMLKAREANKLREDRLNSLTELVGKGKVPPSEMSLLMPFAEALLDADTMIQFADQESPVHAVEALAELLDKRPISPCFYDFSMLMPPKHYTESQKQDSEKPENPAYLI